MTRDDWAQWKVDSCTRAFLESIKERIGLMEWELARRAGLNEKQDRYESGYIAALDDILEFEVPVEEIEDESETSGSEDTY